ncbi:MAG: enoyl-CoA hydratase/isomerase family protein [Oscillospiraceae bacterium]|nr:enoyl-CoA hydratase/isomerase family protein [Oscillospiraceae bacterium]
MSRIDLELTDRIAVVTLRNEPLNIFDIGFYTEVREFMLDLNARSDFDAVVITSGCRHFSGGGDLPEIQRICSDVKVAERVSRAVAACMGSIYHCKKPVIAAVHGNAIGSGTGIAASCDLIIAQETSKFAVPEINVGFIGASEFMQLLVPKKLARYYAYTGKPITGAELKRWGGVLDTAGTREEVLEKAMAVAREIAARAPAAVSLFKAAMNYNDNEDLEGKFFHEMRLGLGGFYGSDDAGECIAAMLEKRKPVYTGK